LIHSWHNPSVRKIQECISDQYCRDQNLGAFDTIEFDYTLESWAKQGILLLNQSITRNIEKNESHKRPWNKFILAVIDALNKYKPGTIILLWGEEVKRFQPLVEKHHHVFTWEHPSKAYEQYRKWECPNFKQTDEMIECLYGRSEKINW
jgi:uracil DNA glycosylase